jgi:hypothetical protein
MRRMPSLLAKLAYAECGWGGHAQGEPIDALSSSAAAASFVPIMPHASVTTYGSGRDVAADTTVGVLRPAAATYTADID